jgi:Protein of unknown function (DUF1549)/Protein of unknown function (DUF1553)
MKHLVLCVTSLILLPGNSVMNRAQGGEPNLPLSFRHDIIPVLNKFGCNSGACHGKATGQNGFKLSLFGFDPETDFAAIVQEGLGRRVSQAAPDASMLLLKATGQIAHGGGKRFAVDSEPARLLKKWLAAGTPWGSDKEPEFIGLQVKPAEHVMDAKGEKPLSVIARFSDASTRDVTATAEYYSQKPALLQVDDAGVVKSLGGQGEGTVMVRYLGAVASPRIVIPYRRDLPEKAYAGFEPRGFIDELALKKWRMVGIAPSPAASDADFLRRATLDVTGALPTPKEVRDFLADASADKRDRLIDRLLQSDRYALFWASKWGDLLRNKQQNGFKESTVKFADWLRDAFKRNMPYDQFVRELLTVTGERAAHPQIDWYRQLYTNQNRVEDVSQVFLGLRVSCSNCHNHPFERISQNDYWQFAGFFARLDMPGYGPVDKIGVKAEGDVTNPRTMKTVKPKGFGGAEFEYVKGEDPRVKLVDWMTQRDNPYFARAISNRIWAHYMNRGLVEAPDDMRATNPPTNPELLDALAADLVAHRFDLKHLTRQILKSRVYGLSVLPVPENAADQQNYARHYPRRLPAQVLLDALSSATGVPEKFRDFPLIKSAVELPTERVESDFLDLFGRSQRDTVCECEASRDPNLSQVLFLMNAPELQAKLANPEGTPARLAKSGKATREIVEELFLLTFSRFPSREEAAAATALIEGAPGPQRQIILEDLLWTLVNSKEFLFAK